MSFIHLMQPDHRYGEFLKEYLEVKGFNVSVSDTFVECFSSIARDMPELIIADKESPYLDIDGFFIKKRTLERTARIPLFVAGDFNPAEIARFKTQNVQAFLSRRINPQALVERIHQHFNYPVLPPEKRTPMLVDLNARDSTLIIQIEGNLEPEKLILLSYRLRLFLAEKKYASPRVMVIIPSLYPDMVNKKNLERLFSFLHFKEVKADPSRIVVLTRNKPFIETMGSMDTLSGIRVVESYYEGFRAINADFDLATRVDLEYVKPGSRYFLDLYDDNDRVRLSAQKVMTEALLARFKAEGLKSLRYFGKPGDNQGLQVPPEDSGTTGNDDDGVAEAIPLDVTLDDDELLPEVDAVDDPDDPEHQDPLESTVIEYITREFTPIPADAFDEGVMNEKQNLFFSRVRGQSLLFVSLDKGLFDLVQQALSVYFNIRNVNARENIRPVLAENVFSIIFIDLAIPHETVMKILQTVRSHSDRKRTTIILMGKTVKKEELMVYKRFGTDHVILQPYTTEKFFQKVYQAVSADREE